MGIVEPAMERKARGTWFIFRIAVFFLD